MLRLLRAPGQHPRALEHPARFAGGLFGAVDEPDVVAHDAPQQRLEQRVVCAAEDERVDVRIDHGAEIFLRDETCRFALEPPFLDEWNEQRAGARRDVRVR